jgi:hypothetical protein
MDGKTILFAQATKRIIRAQEETKALMEKGLIAVAESLRENLLPHACRLKLLEGRERLSPINGRWPSTHQHSDTNGLQNLFAGGAGAQRIVDVIRDATVASRRNADPQRNEFFNFCAQCTVGGCMSV